MALSMAQRRALAILPKVSGSLSFLSSSLLVFTILRCSRKRARIYHRLILLIASIDCVASIFWGLSTWPIPASSDVVYSVGNQQTCTFQGFFLQTSITSPICNCMLALYYFFVLKNDWPEKHVRKYERLMYSFPLLFGYGTAIMGIPLKLFNNANLWCWIAPFPAGCEGDSCIRGQNANVYRWAIYYGPLWLSLLIVTCCQISIFIHLRTQLTHSKKFHSPSSEFKQALDNNLLNETQHLTEAQIQGFMKEEKARSRMRTEIILQCFMYAGTFYVTWISLTTVRVLQAMEKPVPYQLIATACFVTPLQGLPNLMIYMYPRFLRERENHPSDGFLLWLKNTLLKQ